MNDKSTTILELSRMFDIVGYLINNQQYDKVDKLLAQLDPSTHQLEMCIGIARFTFRYRNNFKNWNDLIIRIYNGTADHSIDRQDLLMGLMDDIDKKLLK